MVPDWRMCTILFCRTILNRLKMAPPSRMTEMTEKLQGFQSKESGGPCGSFTFAYHFMCDYHNVHFSEEVAWVKKRQVHVCISNFSFYTTTIHHEFHRIVVYNRKWKLPIWWSLTISVVVTSEENNRAVWCVSFALLRTIWQQNSRCWCISRF